MADTQSMPGSRRRIGRRNRVSHRHLRGARPHHRTGAVDSHRRRRPRGAELAVERPHHPHQGHHGGPGECHPRDVHPHGRRADPGRLHRRHGRHPSVRAGQATAQRQAERRVSPHLLGRTVRLSLHRPRLLRLRGPRGGTPLGLLATAGPHHPLHHGDSLHRQVHRVSLAPGAGQLPRGCSSARHVHGVFDAQGGPEDRRFPASSPVCSSPSPSPSGRRRR